MHVCGKELLLFLVLVFLMFAFANALRLQFVVC